MKNLILLLITITAFNNVSYASFPVAETQQIVIAVSANAELPNYRGANPVWCILSITCTLLSLMLLPNPLAATIISLLGVIFGAIGFNKKLKGLAITGFILSLIIFLAAGFLTFLFLIYGEDPTKLGG